MVTLADAASLGMGSAWLVMRVELVSELVVLLVAAAALPVDSAVLAPATSSKAMELTSERL